MTELTLSIFNPNTLLPHRAGIAGLALALSALNPTDAPLQWEVTEDAVNLAWDGSDQDAIQWLLAQTYRSDHGYLEAPALKLDDQGRYIFSEGVVATFLQHSQQRTREKETVSLNFTVDENQPEIRLDYRPIVDCYYTRGVQDAFSTKGLFKKEIPLKGHHLPGLVECFINGAYVESPSGFVALLFLPLACAYYQLPGFRSALVIPEVLNLTQWVELRQKLPGRTYKSFRSSSAGESALNFLLREKLADNLNLFRVDYCEVYRLGSQPWDGNQSYLKQAVYRVQVSDRVLALYGIASGLFPPKVQPTKDGKGTWLAESKVLAWMSDNLIVHQPWYRGFFEFRKANAIYPDDRKGLIVMTEHLSQEEKLLFDCVSSAFGQFRRKQFKARKDHLNRELTKEERWDVMKKTADKAIYQLQHPNTQRDFAKALVDFLSRHRGQAALGNGLTIYEWLYKNEHSWRQVRDLALLAIATYQGKSQEEKAEIEQEIEQSSVDFAPNIQ